MPKTKVCGQLSLPITISSVPVQPNFFPSSLWLQHKLQLLQLNYAMLCPWWAWPSAPISWRTICERPSHMYQKFKHDFKCKWSVRAFVFDVGGVCSVVFFRLDWASCVLGCTGLGKNEEIVGRLTGFNFLHIWKKLSIAFMSWGAVGVCLAGLL